VGYILGLHCPTSNNTSKIYIYRTRAVAGIGSATYTMHGRGGGSRGSAPGVPYLNEARPAAIAPEGLSGRRGAPTGAKVRGVTSVIFLILSTKQDKRNSVETLLLINPYKRYNPKI
jgi:hypothetical protein